MISDLRKQPKLAGAASAVETIAELLTANDQFLSGVMGTDDKLQLTFVETFYCKMNDIPIGSILNRPQSNQTTGILLFEVFPNEQFSMNRTFVRRLSSNCEAMHMSLLDIILYSREGWASLRQQNLL